MHSPLVSPRAHIQPAGSRSARPAGRLARCRHGALLLLAGVLSLAAARAQTLYWDANADTAGAGGSTPNGTWGTDLFWSTDPLGAALTAGWTSGNTAVFAAGNDATGSYTVYLGANQTVGGLVIEDGEVSFVLSNAITLGTGNVAVNSGATLTTDSSLRVSASAGATMTLNGGTLKTLNTGVAGTFIDQDFIITLGAAGGTFSYDVPNILNIVQDAGAATVVRVTGPGGLTKSGMGVLAVAALTDYQGATIINDGELRIRTTANRLPTNTAVTINSPGILNLNGIFQAIGTLSGNGKVGLGASTLTFGGAADTVFSGSISNVANAGAGGVTTGAGRLSKRGPGSITFTGTNGFTGSLTNNEGSVNVAPGAILCDPTADIVVNAGSLNFSNTAQTILTLSGAGGTVQLAPGHTLNVNPTSGSRTYTGTVAGAGALLKTGAGTLGLAGNNTYQGTTTISAGKIHAQSGNALGDAGTGTSIASGAELLFDGAASNFTVNEALSIAGPGAGDGGAITVQNSANITLSGPVTLIGDTTNTVSGTGTVLFNHPSSITAAANQNLTLQGGGISTGGGGTIAGIVSLGTGSLTKQGGGRWTLGGANSYSGGTFVNAGTLRAANTSGSAFGSGPVTVAAGASVGGPGAFSGQLTLNGTLAPGASPGTLNTGDEIWNGGASYAWEINNATGSQGADPGWDLINITGTLTINATPASKFNLNLLSLTLANAAGAAANFDGTTDFTWTIVKTTAGINNFDAAAFNINTNGFVSPRDATGLFLVETANGGNDIVLRFVRTPAVATPPASTTVACGASVPLTVTATGTAPLSYRWRRNGTPLSDGGHISGTTTAALTLNPASAFDNGSYDVVVTNLHGSITSAVATVTVTDSTPPSIACPSDITVKVLTTNGSSVAFTPVAVDDCAPTPVISCLPPSGSTFLIGTHTVTCTASDGANTTNCSFLVNVYYQDATNKVVNTPVPDNDGNGLASTLTVASPIGILTDVNVTLHITNGWNGDLYCYLTHSSGFSVLLNRVGRRTGSALGYGDAGFNVTLDEEAANGDIHVYRATLFSGDNNMALAGMLTNAWRPDGRATSPTNVLDTDTRTALLSSFNGVNPNGDWTLFVADLEAGDQSTLVSWGLELCGILPIPASIPTQSPSQNIECSSNLTLFVTTAGTGPLTNQWYKDGMSLGGATNLTLALNDAHPAASGTYTFVVCNMANCATSAPIVIGVIDTQPPVISACATNQTVCPDATSQFAVPNVLPQVTAVDGCSAVALTQSPLAGTLLGPGTHTITITATDVSNLTAQCTATLVVQTNTTATALTPVSVCPGSPVSFSTVADGTGPFTYQWYKAATPILNATNASFAIPAVVNADAGNYCVVVTGSCNSVTNCAALTVFNNVTATALLSVTNGCPGSPILFATLASGTGPISYQWTRAGTNIPGANGFSYLIPSPSTADNDTYCVIVSGLCTSVTNCATISIATPPVISAQPQNQIRPMGNSATFSVTATGPTDPATLAIQWYSNGVAIAGATTTTLALNNLQLHQNGWAYFAVVTNCAGAVTSSVATLTVEAQSGIAFDFNTPGQWTNTPYAMAMNNFINTALPAIPFESATGGVGVATGSGALDLTFNNATANSSTLLPLTYDFSLPGRTLVASAMVKIKVPLNNTRNTQIGFVTTTNVDLDNSAGRSYMTVILQPAAQPALTFNVRQGSKPNGVNTFIEGNITTNSTLISNRWYRLTATFVNSNSVQAGTYRVTGVLQDMGADGLAASPTTVSLMGPVTITNADVTSASRLFFVLRGIENTGLDYWDNVYVSTTNGPVFFVQGPQSQSVLHGRPLKLQALVDGDGPYAYQWQKSNSGAGFVNIPGGTTWNLFVPAVSSADNQAHYRVVVNGPSSSATSTPALITVTPDALDIVSAGSVDGCAVGIRFDQAVDPVSAANPANYLINGVPAIAAQVYQSPTDLRHIVQNGTRVVVTPASMFSGAFTVSVSGVLDASGNPIAGVTTAAGTSAGLTGEDVNPYFTAPAGQQYSFADGQFEVSGGGADIWNLADSLRYVHRQVSGDFDVQVKIPHVDVMRGATKAGLDVRTSLDPFSPQVLAAVNPQVPARNFTEGTFESTYNVNAASWGTSSTIAFPNVWLRLRRVGNTFLRYRSTDGSTWAFDGQVAPIPALPDSVYLGLAVCSVNNGNLATAWFENYANFAGYPGATIAITASPVNLTTNAGNAVVLTAAATVTGAPATELAYLWQRSNGVGGWTNVPLGTTTTTGVASTNALNTGALFASDNGAQYRVVVSAPGALSVTSAVATVTVNDAVAPTIVAGHVPTNAIRQIILIYSEPMGASALNAANYAVTNGPGASFGVAGAVFLNGDTRVVQLTTVNDLTPGPYGVLVNGVQDLGGTAIAANTVRLVYQLGFGTGQPFVVELYGGLPAGGSITDLVNSFKFAGGDGRYSYPELINYSNVFGINHGTTAFPDTLNAYGVRMYSWFVPPTNGDYRFYLRGDDFVQLWMNTNPASSTLPPDAIIASSNSIPPNAFGSPVAEQAYWAFDNNTNTKYLNNFGLANAGVVVTPAMGSSVVTGLRLSTANDVPDRDPMSFRLEGTTGDPSRGPWTLIASGVTGLPTNRFTVGPAQSFPNGTAYTSYRLIFPTVRNSAQALMQVSEIELLDGGGVDVTGRGAIPRINLTAANANYAAANSFTNTLVGGQRYFIEMRYKETSGGDGGTVAVRNDSVVPAATEVAAGNLFERPAPHAPNTPVQIELYTGLVQANPISNGRIDDLIAVTNTPAVVAAQPNVTGFGKHFGFSTNLANTSFDNYYGRVYANFIAPSNGLYKFYLRADDSAQLWMNTNAVNSTDPAGVRLLGYLERFINVTYWLTAENVWLNGGQRYYMEGRWREGTGGDGFAVAIRSQGDFSTPQPNELLPASMFEMATNVVRYGPVQVAGITPLNPTVNVGESIVFQAVGINGAGPFGIQWLKNGVQVMANALTYTNPPVTAADNGAVFTLVVTNAFSRAEVSSVITVPVDNAPPTLVSAVGSQYQEFVTVTFDGPVEAMSAACLANYRINNGVQVLAVALDTGRRNRVSLRTSPQTPGTIYTVTVNGVKDPAGNVIAANSTINYTAWTWGGCGFLVELFTNITGSAVLNLTTDGKYVNNLPDVAYYTNVFGAGRFAADSGLNNYGARVSAYVQPPSNGLYRFYVRGDDGTMLFMNTNGPDARGRVMIARNDGANSASNLVNVPQLSGYETGIGNGIPGASISPVLSLTNGTSYYIEALLKEGGGGDHVEVVFRAVDPGTLANVPALPLNPTAADLNPALAVFFAAPGNPDAVQLVISEAPPTTLNVRENDLVNLRLVASIVPPSARFATCYQWQKETAAGSGVFTNIPGPGAVSPILPTFAASLADNGVKYRLIASLPAPRVFTTTLNVTADFVGPTLVSASSLDGTNLHLCFSETIDRASGTAEDTAQFTVNGGAATVLSAQLRTNDERTVVLNLATPVSGQFVVEAGVAGGIQDLAVNFGTSIATGVVQNLLPADVGAPPGPGSSFSCKDGEIDVIAGGADIWGASDQGHMVLRPVCGDFDVWVRLQRLDRAPGDNDGITKAGLMVRESWAPDARKLHVLLEPPASIGGREFYEAGQRPAVAAATAAWNGGSGNTLVIDRAGIPAGWMRIKRTGNMFEAFRSTDGVNWSLATTNVVNYSNVVYVGVAATAHIPSPSAATTFAEFRDLHLPFPPTILVAPSPADQTVPALSPVSWTVTASSPVNAGPLTYQWQRNGNPIAGATNATYSIASVGSADAGFYTVVVGNHGGCVSANVTLNVNNGLPVVSGEMLMATQNVASITPAATLLGNDMDPEGQPLSMLGVSGSYPGFFNANFEDGGLPAGSALYGTPLGNPGAQVGDDGSGTNKCIHLTDVGNASAFGAYVVEDPAAGKTVNQLHVRWRQRIGGAVNNTLQFNRPGADGMALSWGADVPAVPVNAAHEDGLGTGLIVTFDTWDNGGFEAPGIEIKWRGTALTNRVAFDSLSADQGIAKDMMRKDRFVDASLTLTPDGVVTLVYDGMTMSAALPGFTGIAGGRFAWAGRTGGAFDNHWIDDVSILALTRETTLASSSPVGGFTNNFNAGLPGGAGLFGTPLGAPTGARVGDDGTGTNQVVHLTDQPNSSAFGALMLPDLAAGKAMNTIDVQWRQLIGGGTNGGTQFGRFGADGMSFSWAADLPTTPVYTTFEEGVGGGLSVTFDTWDSGGLEAPGIEIRWRGARVAFDPIDADQGLAKDFLRKNQLVNARLTVNAAGQATVTYDGRTLTATLSGWTGIAGGRFMWAGRTGGAWDNTWVDDISINGTSVDYGQVSLAGGTVTYTPPTNGCGLDHYYYVASDGQLGGLSVGQVDVQIKESVALPPVIAVCAPNQTYSLTNACTQAAPDLRGMVLASDNCCCLTYSQTPAPGTPLPLGSHMIQLVATDTMGLSATCTATVVVQDVAPPQIACPAPITAECMSGNSAVVSYPAPVVSDNCSSTVLCLPPSGSSFPSGVTMVTCIAMDPSANSANCQFTVTVVDTTAPAVTCQSNMVVFLGAGLCQTAVSYAPPAYVDCDGSISIVCSPVSGSIFPAGTNVVNCTVTDSSANTSSCSFRIAVIEIVAPVIACPVDTSVECGSPTTPPATGVATATDNCDTNVLVTYSDGSATEVTASGQFGWNLSVAGAPATSTAGFAAGPGVPPLGTGSLRLTVGADGDSLAQARNTNFHGVRLAHLTELGFRTWVTANNGNGETIYLTLNVDSDNNGTADDLLVFEPEFQSGYTMAVPNQGVVTLATWQTWNAMLGGWYSLNQPGIMSPGAGVKPLSAYLAVYPNARIVNTGAGAGGVRLVAGNGIGGWENFVGSADRFAIGVNGVSSLYDFDDVTGTGYDTIVRTWTAMDDSGNRASCSQVIRVVDTTVPVVTCSPNLVLECSLTGGATANFVTTATDICDPAPVLVCTPTSGSVFALGTNTVNCVATDSRGNSNTCSFTVAVIDTTSPSIVCPAPVVVECAGPSGAPVSFTATASDVCDPSPVVVCVPPSGATFAIGTNTVNCTATDMSANTATCSFTVRVRDTTRPVLTACAMNQSVPANANCEGMVPNLTGQVTAADLCGPVNISQVPLAGTIFTGSLVVTLTVTDLAGNSTNCTATLTAVDVTVPVIGCPANFTAECATPAGTVVNFTTVATDNCTGSPVVTCVPASGSVFPPGATTVNCVAVDGAGNSNTCSFAVTVIDTTDPTRCSNPPVAQSAGGTNDNFVGVESALPSADLQDVLIGVDLRDFDDAGADEWFAHTFDSLPDDISGAVLRIKLRALAGGSENDTIELLFSTPGGGALPQNWIRRIGTNTSDNIPGLRPPWTAGGETELVLDLAALPNVNNTTTDLIPTLRAQRYLDLILQDDTMVDYVVLEVTTCQCGPDIQVNTDPMACGAVVSFAAPVFSDNCDTNVAVVCTPASGSFFPLGTTTVECRGTDDSGNVGRCSFNVTVVEPGPALQVQLSGANVVVSWPITCANYRLEQATSLNPVISWSTVGAPVFINMGRYTVTLPIQPGNRYFRLANP